MVGLPAWYPDPAEAKAAPMPLLLVQGFLNTDDPDSPIDLLADVDHAVPWLTAAGLLAGGVSVGSPELELARAVRAGLRDLLASAGTEPDTEALATLRRLAEARRPKLTIDDRG